MLNPEFDPLQILEDMSRQIVNQAMAIKQLTEMAQIHQELLVRLERRITDLEQRP